MRPIPPTHTTTGHQETQHGYRRYRQYAFCRNPNGYPDFHLVHGDLSAQTADWLVFSANAGTERLVGRVLDFYCMWRARQWNRYPQ